MKNYLQLLLMLLLPSSLFSSNYYWVGGTGNWSDYTNHWSTTSGGLVFHVQVPTPFDNVIFDTSSFSSTMDTVFIDSTLFTCNTMNWTGVRNKPVFSGNSTNGTLQVYGNFILDTGMVWNYNGLLEFNSFSTGNTIVSKKNYLHTVFFNGTGNWILQDSLYADTLKLQAGDLYSNNQAINCNTFLANILSAGGVHLGTSTINVLDRWIITSSSFADADSATINMFSSRAKFQGGNKTYHDVNFTNTNGNSILDDSNTFDKVTISSNMTISANNTFDTLYCNYPGQTITLVSGTKQTIIDTIAINGACTGWTTLHSSDPSNQSTIYKINGNVDVSNVVLQDIDATGGATFSASNSVIISNVTGWTMLSPLPSRNLYWVGGSGNWNNVSHWDSLSGGPGGFCVPSPLDNVFFDSNSFTGTNDTVYFNAATGYCKSMDWTNSQNNPLFMKASNGTLNIFGSLTFIGGMTNKVEVFSFNSQSPGNTITTAGQKMDSVEFNGIGGGWTLQDTMNANYTIMLNGTFYSNDQMINSPSFISNGSVLIYLGTSTINAGYWQMNSFFLDADSTTINTVIFGGGSNNYHNVNFLGSDNRLDGSNTFDTVTVIGNILINSGNTFGTLNFNTPGQIITLGSGSTQLISDSLTANGTCSGLTVIQSGTPLSQATISKTNGTILLAYVLMQDINATGGASFTATNSVALYNVTGWNVAPMPIRNLYWVGGTGNWNDPNHWATTSGGAGGNCVPTPFDNVFFDVNSFTGTNDIVFFNTQVGYSYNMNWAGALNNPQFVQNVQGTLKIFGSLNFINGMTNAVGNFSFQALAIGATITTAGQNMGSIAIDGLGGSNKLMDALNAAYINIDRGYFYSNNRDINCANNFWSNSIYSCALYLGTSTVNVNGSSPFCGKANWFMNSSQLTLDADSATINMTGNSYPEFYGGGQPYHHVNFTSGSASASMNDSNTFDQVVMNGNMSIASSNIFDTLYFNNPGQTVTLRSNTTQTINNSFMANSMGGFPIGLHSSGLGMQSTISMPAGDTVCLNYIYMQDQNATGGGVFYAGIYSSDISNNTGWQFTSCNQPISDVWPGDANYDLVANNMDILNIGIAFGETGFVRPGASNTYTAQPCLDWPSQFQNGVNTKHADCDGNGIVDLNDTLAVSLNYGQNHPPKLIPPDSINAAGPDLYFQMPSQIPANSTISVPVMLGTSLNPANNIYGIAFTVNYDTNMVVAGSVGVSYDSSWMVSASNNVHLEKDFYSSGKIDLGFSRIDHQNVSGDGIIVVLTFTTRNNDKGKLELFFTDAKADDAHGSEVPINPLNPSNPLPVIENARMDGFAIYPNPSSDYIYVTYKSQTQNPLFEIVDVTGRKIADTKQKQIDISNLPQGVYLLKVTDGNLSFVKRLVKN